MPNPKQIPRPSLQHARRLTPLQLNNILFDRKHTILTPELLEQMARQKAQSNT